MYNISYALFGNTKELVIVKLKEDAENVLSFLYVV